MKRFRFESFCETSGSVQAILQSKYFLQAFEVGPAVLSIWGSVGNGKTHMLGAICNKILDESAEARISVASLDLNEPIDFSSNIVILDSADLSLRSGRLSTEFLMQFREKHISVLISSVIQPSKYLAGSFVHFQNYFEGEIAAPTPKELTQFVDLRYPPIANQISLIDVNSFRRVEAEVAKARIQRELSGH